MKKRLAIAELGIATIVVITGCSPSSPEDRPFDAPQIKTETKKAYIQAINNARSVGRACGDEGYFDAAPDVNWSDALYKAAYEHDVDMAQTNHITHDGSGKASDHTAQVKHLSRGSHFNERIQNNGYAYSEALEDLTVGTDTDTVEKAVNAWIHHSGHCKNLMDANVTDFGMAYVHDDNGTPYKDYWTLDLAKPIAKDTWL